MHTAYKCMGLLLASICSYSIGNGQSSITYQDNPHEPKSQIIEPGIWAHWYMVGAERDLALSPDGKYATWSIDNWRDKKYTFVVGATGSEWKLEFHNEKFGGDGFFVANSRQYIFPAGEALCMVPLGTGQPQYMRPVVRWQQDGTGRWLAWQEKDSGALMLKNLVSGRLVKLEATQSFQFDKTGQWLLGRSGDNGNELYVYNLSNGKILRYRDVEGYRLQDSRVLLLVQKNAHGAKFGVVKLPAGTQSVIYTTDGKMNIVNYDMDNMGTAFTFTTREMKDSIGGYAHWYYKEGLVKPVKLVEDQSLGIEGGLKPISGARFIKGDKFLYFMLMKEPDKRTPPADAVMVDVWSHTDEVFYSAQPMDNRIMYYPSVVSVEGGKVVQLVSKEYEELAGEMAGEYALVSKRQVGDRFWEYKRDSIWLVHLKEGTRKLLPFIKTPWVKLDEGGTAVVGFDTYRGRHYYRYDLITGIEKKLSVNVPDWTLGIEHPFMLGWEETGKKVNHVIAAHTADQKAILVYDNYDIWRIDLTGKTPAVNITNGYGRKNKLVFRLTTNDDKVVSDSDVLLLTAFDEKNKDNGFYRKRLIQKVDPDSLFMGPYFFAHDRKILVNLSVNPYGTGMKPIKAKAADAWLVRRESATEAPNYYFTSDCKVFKPLTGLQPHRRYNWYTTELVNFTQENGVANQGVLYKPADFDPKKKYPVLFYYYEQFSYGLNRFILPEVSSGGKPVIPWYVSRGYLVFTPDNYFQKEGRYRSCWQSVVGGARHISKFPYVDSLRMGIMGLSQGGGFTNYIITHSNLFAAAFEGCGVSDRISAALQWVGVNGEDGSRLLGTETLNGSNMWDNPEQWVSESSVLQAHTVTTPLLIMHNKKDGAVLFEQAVEIFTALRRWNKKVWLLQYDEGSHGVGGKEALDLTTRITQFFDHYLKGMTAPRWMIEGIPASAKGIENGLELAVEKDKPK